MYIYVSSILCISIPCWFMRIKINIEIWKCVNFIFKVRNFFFISYTKFKFIVEMCKFYIKSQKSVKLSYMLAFNFIAFHVQINK